MLTPPRLRIDHLYVITAIALGSFIISLIPIVPHDFWWHMAIGRDIARQGAVPTQDLYSWSLAPGTSFTYQSWLSEVIFYQVYQLGGLTAITALRNCLFLLTLLILAIEARRRSGSWRLAAFAVVGAAFLFTNNATMRPQTFSWLPFALFLLLLASYRSGNTPKRTLLLLPLIMMAWVNLHGAFILGIILAILTAIGETVKYLFHRPADGSWRTPGWLWLIVGLTTAATVVNPTGLGVFGYVRDLLTDVPSQRLVVEWQPLSIRSPLGGFFAFTVFLSAGLWVRTRSRVDMTDLLLWAGFLWIAVSGARYVIWWGMLTWPLMAGLITASTVRRAPILRATFANTCFALVLLLLPLAAQPPFKGYWQLPPAFRGLGTTVPDGPLMAPTTPVRAVNWLQEHPLPADARLFHDMGFGSYLIWAAPHLKVYVDPRVELYPLEEWLRYKRITAACNYNRELRELGVSHMMLSRDKQPELVSALLKDASWRALYDDGDTIIYERAAAGGNDADCN
jgi:hypothetical protein